MEYKFNADNKTPSSFNPKIISYNNFSTNDLYKMYKYYTELEEKAEDNIIEIEIQMQDTHSKLINSMIVHCDMSINMYKDLYDNYKELLQFYKNQSYLNTQCCELIRKELKKRNILIKE